MKKLVVITGGIGSGKSVVAKLLKVMGFPVYDCDSRAKVLMNTSGCLKEKLTELLGTNAYRDDGTIDRAYVASCIFGNDSLRKCMNAIVHPAVRNDLQQWIESQQSHIVFAETALLLESGLNDDAHAVWVVDAPEQVRIERVMRRSGLTHSQVANRVSAQAKQIIIQGAVRIINDGSHSLISQVSKAIDSVNV